jgi:hypothetical protein
MTPGVKASSRRSISIDISPSRSHLSKHIRLPSNSGPIGETRWHGLRGAARMRAHWRVATSKGTRGRWEREGEMSIEIERRDDALTPGAGLSNRSRVAWESDVLARSGSHKRNVSEPGQDPPMLEPTSTNSEKGSSVFPETPHLPSRQMESGYSQSRQPLQKAGDEPGIDPTRRFDNVSRFGFDGICTRSSGKQSGAWRRESRRLVEGCQGRPSETSSGVDTWLISGFLEWLASSIECIFRRIRTGRRCRSDDLQARR